MRLVTLVMAAALAACATPRADLVRTDFAAPTERARIVLMPPNVGMSLLTSGGLRELRADWTAEAEANLTEAIGHVIENRGHDLETARADGRSADAIAHYRAYLERAPDAADRAFIERYLVELGDAS